MNTKFLFVLLVVVIVLTACAPGITSGSAPVVIALQTVSADANQEKSALVPVTGENEAVVRSTSLEPKLWSGAVSLSDNSNPDLALKIEAAKGQKTQSACMSEDSLPHRQSGCIE